MGKIKNVATHNTSGKVGSLVYRTTQDGAVLSGMPGKSAKPATEEQKKVRTRFRAAAEYGRLALNTPALLDFYTSRQRPGRSAYFMAMSDYLKAPEFEEINHSAYDGSLGSRIVIKAIDDGRVTSVTIRIEKADGVKVEGGDALKQENGSWLYTATASNASLAGGKIIAAATDMPGNVTVKEIQL
jgi:hypothetical protein